MSGLEAWLSKSLIQRDLHSPHFRVGDHFQHLPGSEVAVLGPHRLTLPTSPSGGEWEPAKEAAQPLVLASLPSSRTKGKGRGALGLVAT